ncbi:glycogen debranching N-terminal domain-containing protein [Streptomyces sp. SL13]|uniref:Glycogen debranching N-terminal domain-containing protein n=1 Tax=Streptantibioticus silvisoli TaxID=2705255 RepID=A0AA90GVK1_9ACTN|nr:glycogen debranching N-terminal domain-containing protein [Streptantibioticus silvisoli]MDI5968883.1 glycogen debranching N-terminal domain-containing protein [Streptantibioticus silvisoli]
MSGTAQRLLVHRGTFAATGPAGDITGGRGTAPDGLFVRDARHLSRWRLTAAGRPLVVLTTTDAGAVLVPPGTRDEPPAFTVLREQAVGHGTFAERLRLVNNLGRPARVTLELTAGADFADQFELRSDGRGYDKPGATHSVRPVPGGVEFGYRRGDDWTSSTTVTARPQPDELRVPGTPGAPEAAVRPGDGTDWKPAGAPAAAGTGLAAELMDRHEHAAERVLVWHLTLPPHAERELTLAVRAFAAHGSPPRATATPARLRAEQHEDVAEFTAASPRPAAPAGRADLLRAAEAGLTDLAGLRVPATGPDGEVLRVPGAGTPWFLTLFGRDSLLTSLFALPYRPALAAATLKALAAAQGTRHRAAGLEQPGRIPHEIRHGELAHFRQVPYGRYYGSVDATPLFLVLLDAHARRTGDPALARRLETHARAAVEWMFRDGGLTGRGYLVYTSDAGAGGLENQNWKDSAGAICRADGTPATGAVAVAEAQGYAYDALLRTARLARDVWEDPSYADRLEAAAEALRERFVRDFWLPGADFPALALDGDGRRADALASDAGHLLWSGILDHDRGVRVGRRLLEPDFFSGWGIRTLAAGQAPYHPLSYHRGSIWPHDNAVIALGLARYGLIAEAGAVADALTEAARRHDWRLPEVMAGYGRDHHPEPVPYPHACSPQAWAAATPLALLTAVGGGAGT